MKEEGARLSILFFRIVTAKTRFCHQLMQRKKHNITNAYSQKKLDIDICNTVNIVKKLPVRKTTGTVKKSTRDSIVKINMSLSSAAKNRMKK